MKKFFYFLFILSFGICILSCDESFDPYGTFMDKYVLNCIIRGDTTFQTATVTQDYQVLNLEPLSNSKDPNIYGTIIRIWNGNDKVAKMRDTTIQRQANDLYKTPYALYYTNNFQPESQSELQIEAILPNGKRLTSVTNTPSAVNMIYKECDLLIPAVLSTGSNDLIHYAWHSDQQNPVYIIRLSINYFKNENLNKIKKTMVIPLNYLQYNNSYLPNYAKPLNTGSYKVDMATITRAMQLISEGDPDKASYEIMGCVLEILSLDQNLSSYYNSTTRSNDLFSVKLNETDYSNIQGGYGIFGVYMKTYFVSYFRHQYLQTFGYTPGSDEGR